MWHPNFASRAQVARTKNRLTYASFGHGVVALQGWLTVPGDRARLGRPGPGSQGTRAGDLKAYGAKVRDVKGWAG